MRIVVTRSGEDAERQAARLTALGHQPLVHPLLEIDFPPVAPLRLDGVQALILTSRNALRGLCRNGTFEAAKSLAVYCVGEGTADLARELGFTRITAGDGTAKDLVPLIVQSMRPQAGSLLYLTGARLAFDLEAPLTQLGFAVTRAIVYESREPDEAAAARLAAALRAGVDAVILMSPQGAANFISLVKAFALEREVSALTCYCFSAAIAAALGELGGSKIAVSPRPAEADLMQLIGPDHRRMGAPSDTKEALGKR